MNAIIIDDEPHCIRRLQELTITHCPQVRLLESSDSVEEGVRLIHKLQPDLVFLDVQLHNSTGFDLLQQLPDPGFDVIFTTAFEQYAIQAFKFSAVDYLLKPVDAQDLQQAVNRLEQKRSKVEWGNRMEALLHNVQSMQEGTRKLCLPTANGMFLFQVSDIVRCEADANYTTVYATGHHPLKVAKTLKELDALLTGRSFFRVHQSHLINLSYVKRFRQNTVYMTDGSQVEVASRRKEDFLKRLSEG